MNFATRDLNEANTRHQLIDPLIHDVLGWYTPYEWEGFKAPVNGR